MSKRFTKIICTAVAAISAASLAFLPACKTNWGGVSGEKDTSAYYGSNGGFVTETEDYVYFINGKTTNTASNTFGSVLKGSVQRIKKTDLNAGNYATTDTVVPSVVYANSSNLNAGLYIYGGYIYYTTPSSDVNADGEVLNGTLEFKRTKLDGTGTSGKLWSTDNLGVDYRFVEVDGTVYILYALSENLYGTSATNIHSVNCSTGKNTILAYNVASYAFDTVDATNAYVYYTMNVPQYVELSSPYGYNQLYMVRADASASPRQYDFTGVDGYNSSSNPMYINYGTHVLDGIGSVNYNSERVNQFNYLTEYDDSVAVTHADYTFTIRWYKDGTLYYTAQADDNNVYFYTLGIEDIDGDKDGKVDDGWHAINETEREALVNANVTTEYEFVTVSDSLYAINATSSGVTRSEVKDGKIGEAINLTKDSASAMLFVRKEADNHTYLYYSATGGNGYTVNRVAVDGAEDDYVKMPVPSGVDEDGELVYDLTYDNIKVLDLDACSDWYKPEFVGEKLFFASEMGGMSGYNYIMVCDLATREDGKSGIMSNKEIDELNKKFEGVTEKIEEYDEKENADGTPAYNHLSSALKYLFNTGDAEYIDELVNAYVNIEGRDKEYVYSEASVQIYKEFAAAEEDWADYKTDKKTINGNDGVYANFREYYYSVVGRMTDGDRAAIKANFKSSYMESYPRVDNSTWWDKLSAGGKAGTVIGILEGCMLVIGGGIILTAYLITRKKTGAGAADRSISVDLTDDRNVDVYGEEGGESGSDGE
ncbi:MAG: hypothetical protein NC033_05170 [Clostridiales bacterium]|nr:hypothetical protein [Clostridiales bacterium]